MSIQDFNRDIQRAIESLSDEGYSLPPDFFEQVPKWFDHQYKESHWGLKTQFDSLSLLISRIHEAIQQKKFDPQTVVSAGQLAGKIKQLSSKYNTENLPWWNRALTAFPKIQQEMETEKKELLNQAQKLEQINEKYKEIIEKINELYRSFNSKKSLIERVLNSKDGELVLLKQKIENSEITSLFYLQQVNSLLEFLTKNLKEEKDKHESRCQSLLELTQLRKASDPIVLESINLLSKDCEFYKTLIDLFQNVIEVTAQDSKNLFAPIPPSENNSLENFLYFFKIASDEKFSFSKRATSLALCKNYFSNCIEQKFLKSAEIEVKTQQLEELEKKFLAVSFPIEVPFQNPFLTGNVKFEDVNECINFMLEFQKVLSQTMDLQVFLRKGYQLSAQTIMDISK